MGLVKDKTIRVREIIDVGQYMIFSTHFSSILLEDPSPNINLDPGQEGCSFFIYLF